MWVFVCFGLQLLVFNGLFVCVLEVVLSMYALGLVVGVSCGFSVVVINSVCTTFFCSISYDGCLCLVVVLVLWIL